MNKNNPLLKATNDILQEKKAFIEEVKNLGNDISIVSANVSFNNNCCIEIEIKCKKLSSSSEMTVMKCYSPNSQKISYKIESNALPSFLL